MKHWMALGGMATILVGCSNAKPPVDRREFVEQSTFDQLSEKVDHLESSVSGLTSDAELKLSDSGYSILRTEFGAITIQWTKTAPEGAGSKLTFKIGNPHATTLSEVKLYGYAIDNNGKSVQLSGMDLRGEAKGGEWNYLTGIVDKATPTQIGSIIITGVTISRISLLARN